MHSENARRPSFDEQAALEELERLRDAIEESRRRRSERSDEFEAFVRSFRSPAGGASPESETRQPPGETPPEFPYPGRQNRDPLPAPQPETVVFEPPLAPEPPVPREQPEPATGPVPPPPPGEIITGHESAAVDPRAGARVHTESSPAAPHAIEAPPAPHNPQPIPAELASEPAASARTVRSRSLAPWAIVGAVVLVGGIAVLVRPWSSGRAETGATASTPPASAEPAAAGPEAPASAQGGSEPAPAASSGTHAMQAELTADRRVWVRVIADGEKMLEREVTAGTRIPIAAERAIVIRAGDAGAVRLRINGADRGLLGRDAEVVTRTFTAADKQ